MAESFDLLFPPLETLTTENGRNHHDISARRRKAISQQYLTPQEEKALVEYVLRMSDNGYHLPVKAVRALALVIRRSRSSLFQIPTADDNLRMPGVNYPQALFARHPELLARRLKAIDWTRANENIYDKAVRWFQVIRKELTAPSVEAENVYNMDETGVLLGRSNTVKVLIRNGDRRSSRGTSLKRVLITAVECISAAGQALKPLIIWPASTHRSVWTSHPTPGWHFACSQKGYTNKDISLYWIKHVFDPQTRARANGKPRILINDGFGTHESIDIIRFCCENNIVLCRLPSHTSHILQPCDVGLYGPLKTAYREQVDLLHRGGAGMVGKQHFTLLYSRARDNALTKRNALAAWEGSGLWPLNPERVLPRIQKPEIVSKHVAVPPASEPQRTPATAEGFIALRRLIEDESHTLSGSCQYRMEKAFNAAEKALADRGMLLDENRLLFQQNCEKVSRTLKSTVVGTAKVMSYEDILLAQRLQNAARTTRSTARTSHRSIRQASSPPPRGSVSLRTTEIEKGRREIETSDFSSYCHILDF